MNDFQFYITLGLNHILDINGYDHILFIVAICLVYSFKDWKKLGWLVTAFTIGHSLTLALATLKIMVINTSLIEFLIPVTILLTAVANMFNNNYETHSNTSGRQRYFFALFFGLIHGLGFSNFLRSILGQEESIWLPLCYFNLGLELGQLIIVFCSLTISFIFITKLHVKPKIWIRIISMAIAATSLLLIWKNKGF